MLSVGRPGILFLRIGYELGRIERFFKNHFRSYSYCYLMISSLQIAFTRKKDFGKEQRELQWAHAQRTLHGLQVPDPKIFSETTNFNELNQLAEEAKRRAEIARLVCHLKCSLFVIRSIMDQYNSHFPRVINRN